MASPGRVYLALHSSLAKPGRIVRYGTGSGGLDVIDAMPVAQSAWTELGVESGLIASDGSLLVSVPFADQKGQAPWVLVRCEGSISLLENLYRDRVNASFNALSVDGKVAGGISWEEDEFRVFAMPYVDPGDTSARGRWPSLAASIADMQSAGMTAYDAAILIKDQGLFHVPLQAAAVMREVYRINLPQVHVMVAWLRGDASEAELAIALRPEGNDITKLV